MTPKEKAEELVNKFSVLKPKKSWATKNYGAMECALIAVDEVLSVPYLLKSEKYFYTQVKQKIEQL